MMIRLLRNQALLLRLFYTNPDQEYYIQEIGRILKKKPGVFQRTLYQMEKEGILRSEYKANARFFKANMDYPLFAEIKSIVFKTVGIVGSLKEVLEGVGRIDIAFIYGSYAKGQETSLSDIDLIIVGSPDETKIIRAFDKLEADLKREINYKLYSLKEVQDAVTGKDAFLSAVLKDQKTMLVGEDSELRTLIERTPHKKAKSGSQSNPQSTKES